MSIAISKPPLFINDVEWPPFFFSDIENGKVGLGKELLNYCINNSSYTLHYKTLPIKRTHTYMQSGELDISVYSYKKERESFVHYGKEPIFFTNYGFASKASDNISIQSMADVKQYHFGHLAGLAHTKELMKIIEGKKALNQVSVAYDIDALFFQLLAKPQRFQIMANALETFQWRAKQLNISEEIKIHDYILARKPYFVTVSKTSKNIKDPAKFLTQFDHCLSRLKQSNTYNNMTNKYGLKPIK